MIIDLSRQAGFKLTLDTDRLNISTEDIQFVCKARYLEEMRLVWFDQDLPEANPTLYWNYTLLNAGDQTELFRSRHLTFGLVLLPSGKVGAEYNKTHGHYHSVIFGSQVGYPEVYTHYYGKLYLLLQRRTHSAANQLDSCYLYSMTPGQSITIPPGYAHILINPSDQPGLIAGLYSTDSQHQYEPIDKMRGAAYYLLECREKERVQPNPMYLNPPPLQRITQIEGTRFAPPDPDLPLWQSFITYPDRYAFLFNISAVESHFTAEDLCK